MRQKGDSKWEKPVLRKSAVFCGFLRKSAVSSVFCANLRLPNLLIYRASRKSAKICKNFQVRFLPFAVSLVAPWASKSRRMLNGTCLMARTGSEKLPNNSGKLQTLWKNCAPPDSEISKQQVKSKKQQKSAKQRQFHACIVRRVPFSSLWNYSYIAAKLNRSWRVEVLPQIAISLLFGGCDFDNHLCIFDCSGFSGIVSRKTQPYEMHA